MPKKVIITGASGFLGNAISHYLAERGYIVTPLLYRLGDVVDESQLIDADILIHCAWDMRKKDNKNIQGSLALASKCMELGVFFVFISSMAAHPGAGSNYGREKLAVEEVVATKGCIIKPGTILGNGGLFAKTCSLARALPVLPVFYSNRARLQTIHIDDLCAAILHAMDAHSHGVFPLAHSHPVPITDFYKQIAALVGKKPLLMPLPGDMILIVIKGLEKLGLRLPITSDNLLGLKYGTVFYTKDACLELGINPMSFEDGIQKMMRQSTI